MHVRVRRLDPDLKLPERAHPGDAGIDLCARVDLQIAPDGGRELVPTGIALAIPEGYGGFVLPRSGLALRHGVTVLNAPGLVDAGYRDEIRVLLVNHDPAAACDVRRGDRIAQLVIQRVEHVEWDEVDELDDTARSGRVGFDGFPLTSAFMHDRRFRFGVGCSKARSRKEFTELARKIEGLGYSTLFVPDHFVEHDLAPTVALAHAAAVTDDLRIGPFVLGNDYKHPVVCAREMASLDLLSDGRLELGIGAGWMTADYEKAGMQLDRPGVRIARLAEAITVMKGLFADGPFTFDGEYYKVTDLDGMPKPVQQPLPFFVGGGAPKILGLAAREAQIVGINANLRSGDGNSPDTAKSLTPAETDKKVGWVREAAGARFDDLELQTLVGFVYIKDDAPAILEGITGAFGVSADDAKLAPPCLVGRSEDDIVASLEERRERWQISYHVIDDNAVDLFAPILARLAGK